MKFWPFEPSIYVKEIYSKLQKIFTKQMMSDVERDNIEIEKDWIYRETNIKLVLVSIFFLKTDRLNRLHVS